MEEDLLTKFLELMSSRITASDLELIKLGNSLGLDLVSFEQLRKSQQDSFVDTIREKALKKMEKNKDNFLVNNNLFYSGSIDFMVSDEGKEKKFFLLETNGGSHRGISSKTGHLSCFAKEWVSQQVGPLVRLISLASVLVILSSWRAIRHWRFVT